ncbi:MAG: 50S ribosomal protein L1 [Chlamydiia bacterium]|nr:50S ribosomal protein L1 [Chlamydiia bacterium]MCH9615363.1 50S ribosomal protein L1 [Chlamydiia bacterium]MCH9628315.1 50S ribosomal protein L1 [Chlamydiia bacterium]
MSKKSKRYKEAVKNLESEKSYTLEQAVELLQNAAPVKFDQSVEINIVTGVDPKKSDQQVRSTVTLPHGTGKALRVVAVCKGDSENEAKEAGADEVGVELIEKIKGGWTDFDVLVATPDMMREIGKLGKVLGPRGLMPTPKAGTVTKDIGKAILEVKKGKVEFKVDKAAVINNMVGKLSFKAGQIVENVKSLLEAIVRAKPATAKGAYIKALYLSSTMGPGLKLDLNTVTQGA